MNFEEWFQSEIDRHKYSYEENDCKIAWKACKQEILKILNKNCFYQRLGSSLTEHLIIQPSVIKEIERL